MLNVYRIQKQSLAVFCLLALVPIAVSGRQKPPAQAMSQQEKDENRNAFRERVVAAAGMVNSFWELVGAQRRLARSTRPRFEEIFIRVQSADPVQILLASVLVTKDLIANDEYDHVKVSAVGSWYGPDVVGMLESTVDIYVDVGTSLGVRWRIAADSIVPSQEELTVAKKWREVCPNVELDYQHMGIPEIDVAKRRWEDAADHRIASELNMSVEEVVKVRLAIGRHRGNISINRSIDAWCLRSDPGLICVDAELLKKPDRFPNSAKVVDDACEDISPTKLGNVEVSCRLGQMHF